jgi:hypothetical protein
MAKSTKPKKKEEPLNTSFEELFNMSTSYVPKNSTVNKTAKTKKAVKKK